MSSVVSEAAYIMTSAVLDLIERIRRWRRRREMFERVTRAERRVRRPPPGYFGFVRVGDRARIVGRATRIVVDAPFMGQTEYEYTPEIHMYTTAEEVVSPTWFDTLKHLYEAVRKGASARGD